MKRFLGSSFGSALLGGAVVGAVFLLAISAGWVESGDDAAGVRAEVAAAAPIAEHGAEDTNLV
ncbi:MAG TPA: hypothetical protein VF729_09360, partial [Solirubrobacterales bacterium]